MRTDSAPCSFIPIFYNVIAPSGTVTVIRPSIHIGKHGRAAKIQQPECNLTSASSSAQEVSQLPDQAMKVL